MPETLLLAALALVLILLLLVLWIVARGRAGGEGRVVIEQQLLALRADGERQEREWRDEAGRQAAAARQDLQQGLMALQQALLAQVGDQSRTQNEQLALLREQTMGLQQAVVQGQQSATAALNQQQLAARDSQDAALKRFGDALVEQLRAQADAAERRMGEVRTAVEARLLALQDGNEKKLEQMRATVDEKLHATLEQRLGESFRQVAERLEQVHKGLGEMQGLARDVGSLNRVLSNVKLRGVFGEVQLAMLLEQVFTPDQYAANVETVPGSGARVEFAIRLPGRRDDGLPLWLPIDAKFPREDYERLLDAQERADPAAAEAAARALEARLRGEAKTIRDKYLAAPHTTDFAILFLPTEGLYAEALRRPGLVEGLLREHHVNLAGPTTLLAMLSSLQMGFRTLALERRSAEVWEVLGAVKTEFLKFGDVLARTKKKLDEAGSTIEQAETRTRAMARRLKSVEAMPDARVAELLPGLVGSEGADTADD
jgi:DNA recombination protein RmuC